MAWIRVIRESEGRGTLKKIYDDLAERRGKIANIMKVQSLNPLSVKTHLELYLQLLFLARTLCPDGNEKWLQSWCPQPMDVNTAFSITRKRSDTTRKIVGFCKRPVKTTEPQTYPPVFKPCWTIR